MDLDSFIAFLQAGQAAVSSRAWWALAWLVLTFAANLFFRAESGASAVAWLNARPWGVRALAICQHWGFDFLGLWDGTARFFRGNPPPPSFGSPSSASRSVGTILPPPPAPTRPWIAPAMLNALSLTLVLSLTGCAAWSQFWTPNRISAAEDVGECIVLESASALLAGPWSLAAEAVIAFQCGSSPADVHKMLVGSPSRIAMAKKHLLAARQAGSSQ